jgi:[protein-PII] uridylyltransferase
MLLKMLTLMTFADIKAVNPDALTPWKAENLWQFYMATANFMDRSVDEVRYHAAIDPTLLNRIRSMVPPSQFDSLKQFLEGLPQRYLQSRLPEQIRHHFQMALNLDQDPVQLDLRPNRQLFDLTVITRDRTRLFADVAGALAAWGMNIVKAGAFSNEAGVIVDSFHFTDVFHTLELNPSEKDRFLANLHDVVAQKATSTTPPTSKSKWPPASNSIPNHPPIPHFFRSLPRTFPASSAKSPSPSADTSATSR